MKNLMQLRAQQAIASATGNAFAGKNDGDIIKKIPAMIQQNSFLGALAFAIEDQNRDPRSGYALAFTAILDHLRNPGIALCPAGQSNLTSFALWLCEQDSITLRVITAESLAFMNVLRRFAKKEDNHANNHCGTV